MPFPKARSFFFTRGKRLDCQVNSCSHWFAQFHLFPHTDSVPLEGLWVTRWINQLEQVILTTLFSPVSYISATPLVNKPDSTHQIDEEEDGGERDVRCCTSDLPPEAAQVEADRDERKDGREEEVYEEGREVGEEEPFDEEDRLEGDDDDDEDEGKLEWPAGVAQASERDLAKLSHKEGVGTAVSASFFSTENTASSVLLSSETETFSVALPKRSSYFVMLTINQKVPFNPCKRQRDAAFP